MMGIKARVFKHHSHINLNQLVPINHFYRQLEAKLDLSFVRELVAPFYAAFGRPSIDPVVFFKLQLIMLFAGIRSERQLLEHVQVNLAFRWYLGYDLNEEVPDHSSLTKIRERYGLAIFRQFFERIVQLCIKAGLVWGKELYFDSTQVEANADMESFVSRFEYELKQYFQQTLTGQTATRPEKDIMEGWMDRYQEPAAWKLAPSAYQSLAEQRISETDADATPLRTHTNAQSRLGYHTHYVVDGGKQRIILACLVTPAAIQDNQPMLDLARWVRFRWQLHTKMAIGDSKYGSVDNIVGLLGDGLMPLTPRIDYNQGKNFYSQEIFRYDATQDVYVCPQNEVLKRQGQSKDQRLVLYRAKPKICQACLVRAHCTTSKSGRTVSRSLFQAELDQATLYRSTLMYAKAMRKRQVWIEPMFAEAKQWHGLRRFRLRRVWRVNIEALLIASVQNIKRYLKPRSSRPKTLDPAGCVAFPLPRQFVECLKSGFYALAC